MKFISIGALATFRELWPSTWHKIAKEGFSLVSSCRGFVLWTFVSMSWDHQVAGKVLPIMLYQRQEGLGQDRGPGQTFKGLHKVTYFHQPCSTCSPSQNLPILPLAGEQILNTWIWENRETFPFQIVSMSKNKTHLSKPMSVLYSIFSEVSAVIA